MSTTLSADTNKKHQTPKSIATKKSILDATIQCFVEIGYHRTTTTEIAKRIESVAEPLWLKEAGGNLDEPPAMEHFFFVSFRGTTFLGGSG